MPQFSMLKPAEPMATDGDNNLRSKIARGLQPALNYHYPAITHSIDGFHHREADIGVE